MALFSDPVPSRPATIHQAATVDARNVRGLGRTVRLTDEDYTIAIEDECLVLAATTSAGDWTLTFPTGSAATGIPDGRKIDIILPAALGGSDSFVTAGVEGGPFEFDAAGDHASVRYLATEDEWHVVNNGIA